MFDLNREKGILPLFCRQRKTCPDFVSAKRSNKIEDPRFQTSRFFEKIWMMRSGKLLSVRRRAGGGAKAGIVTAGQCAGSSGNAAGSGIVARARVAGGARFSALLD